jgi:3-oxoacyl-[acyl-carrier-protein] synthase-3
MAVRIVGIEYHLPARVETNSQLAQENTGWAMEKLAEKSGIYERRVVSPGETALDLAMEAASGLLKRDLVDPRCIDYLIYCTQAPEYYLPSGACILQHRLKLGKHIGAFDYNLGCSGYVYGLQMAQSFIQSGIARNVLLITADTYSRYINPRDRATRTLFGDGASATLLGLGEGDAGLGAFVLGTDGAGAMNLCVPSGGLRLPRSTETGLEKTDEAGCVRSMDNLFMDGPALYTFALTVVPKAVSGLLAKTGRTIADFDWFVFHQANKYMLDSLMTRCKVPADKMIYNYENIGNTVSSTIPIALQANAESGKISKGQRMLLAGFGVGYSWAACELVWG